MYINLTRATCRVVCVGVLLIGHVAMGQVARTRSGEVGGNARPAVDKALRGAVKLRKLVGTGQRALTKTPQFQVKSSIQSSTKRPQDWVRIVVEYDTAPEWIDTLSFRYHVLTLTREDGKKAYSLYRKTVEYANIERGREHISTVYLHPKSVARYGEPVAVHVELLIDGQLIDAIDDVDGGVNLPPDWWENRIVIDSPALTVRDNDLLARYQTPFIHVNIDDQEVLR